jgi:hypothetical protein
MLMLADLRRLPPPCDPVEKIDGAERFMVLDFVRLLDQKGLKDLADGKFYIWPLGDLLPVDLGETLRAINAWYDDTAAALRAPGRAERLRLLGVMDGRYAAIQARVPASAFVVSSFCGDARHRGRQLGEALIRFFCSNTRKILDASDRARQEHANLLVALALEMLLRDKGAYPEKLSDLTDKAPADLFSGKGLIYKREGLGYLLYSVGPDEKDDGGRGRDDDPPGDDIAVRMPGPRG